MSVELFWFCLGVMFAGSVDTTFIILYQRYKRRTKVRPYDWAKDGL